MQRGQGREVAAGAEPGVDRARVIRRLIRDLARTQQAEVQLLVVVRRGERRRHEAAFGLQRQQGAGLRPDHETRAIVGQRQARGDLLGVFVVEHGPRLRTGAEQLVIALQQAIQPRGVDQGHERADRLTIGARHRGEEVQPARVSGLVEHALGERLVALDDDPGHVGRQEAAALAARDQFARLSVEHDELAHEGPRLRGLDAGQRRALPGPQHREDLIFAADAQFIGQLNEVVQRRGARFSADRREVRIHEVVDRRGRLQRGGVQVQADRVAQGLVGLQVVDGRGDEHRDDREGGRDRQDLHGQRRIRHPAHEQDDAYDGHDRQHGRQQRLRQ